MSTPALLWGSLGPDSHAIDVGLEQATGKTQSLVHHAQPWAYAGAAQPFPAAMLQPAYDRGSLVMLDWASWDLKNQSDPAYSLDTITSGAHDAYLHAWAQAAATWRHPFMLRFDAEMNGDWRPYGNQPAKFVAAWRYLHSLFAAAGATNVTWCWCPNACAPAGTQWPTSVDKLAAYYPGDEVVDWTGFDTYNWSIGQAAPWMTFSQTMSGYPDWLGDTYGTILKIAPSKPMVLSEWAAWDGPLKAAWMLDALASIPVHYPQVAAISYFNWASGGSLWPLSGDALAAFSVAVQSPVWLTAGAWTPPDGIPFGAPPLVVDPQRPGLAQELAAAQTQVDFNTKTIALIQQQRTALSQALTDAIAQRDGLIGHLQALFKAANAA